jgi:hypothetical protein
MLQYGLNGVFIVPIAEKSKGVCYLIVFFKSLIPLLFGFILYSPLVDGP